MVSRLCITAIFRLYRVLEIQTSKSIATAEELLKVSAHRNILLCRKLRDRWVSPFNQIKVKGFGKKGNGGGFAAACRAS
jgi:hypothetical protein